MMNRIINYLKHKDRIISAFILYVLIFITLAQIVLRSLFNIPLVGVEEFSRYLFIAFVFTGLAYYYRTDGHIRLEGIQKFLPEKAGQVLRVVIHGAGLLVFFILFISAVYTTLTNYNSITPTISIPFWLFFLPFNIGFGLLVLEHLKTFLGVFKNKHST